MDVFLTGFRIKPLVAISLLLLIMALSEAGPIHRKRHNKKNIENFRKHDSVVPKNRNQLTELQLMQRQQNNICKNETRQLKQKLQKVLKEFNDNYKEIKLNEKKRTGNPSWLPKVNFVSIHSKTNSLARNIKRRFRYTIPKLYRNLYHFKLIFQRLNDVQNMDCIMQYGTIDNRQKLLNSTISEINTIMVIINDIVNHLQFPAINQTSIHVNLSEIIMYTNLADCMQQDLIAYRSYENTMNNWISELECWFPLKHESHQICIQYEDRLKNRRKKSRRNL